MTRTIVASATREIIIGFDQPFCVIGERINPTGRKKLAAEMIAGNFETVIKDALEQVAAGAHVLDVNAGVTAVDPNATEPALLVQTHRDRAEPRRRAALDRLFGAGGASKAALKVAKGRPLVNSVTGEEEQLEAILPLIKKYNVPVVAISNDETGISDGPGRALRRRQEDRRALRRFRHPSRMTSSSIRWSCRSARMGDCRPAGVRAGPAAARGAEGQHHLRRSPTSPSACRTATASTPPSCRWRSAPA